MSEWVTLNSVLGPAEESASRVSISSVEYSVGHCRQFWKPVIKHFNLHLFFLTKAGASERSWIPEYDFILLLHWSLLINNFATTIFQERQNERLFTPTFLIGPDQLSILPNKPMWVQQWTFIAKLVNKRSNLCELLAYTWKDRAPRAWSWLTSPAAGN